MSHLNERSKRIAAKKAERIFSSNTIRLSLREWLLTGAIAVLVLFAALPMLWQRLERLDTDLADFRLAEKYRDNYWLYQKAAAAICQNYPVVFLGDSVVWGMYVDNHTTLTAIINKTLGQPIVGNIAIDGLHSIAMEGLVKYYGSALRNKKVLLHCNPLWMNSPAYDLSAPSDFKPHHPRLLPPFSRAIQADRGSFSEKVTVYCEQKVLFYSWLHHIRQTFFDNKDFKDWIIDNYDANPLARLSLNVQACERLKTNSGRSWREKGIPPQQWNWVAPEHSRQFQAFLRTIKALRQNGNEICVMVGPINPHMLDETSLVQWRALQQQLAGYFEKLGIECILAEDLPSEMYADASHPLAEGYRLLAVQIMQSGFMSRAMP